MFAEPIAIKPAEPDPFSENFDKAAFAKVPSATDAAAATNHE